MSNLGEQVIYKQLLERHGRIRIPMIQRDYAQGRPTEVEVREEFLEALEGALKRLPTDPSLPLNLDFIYGSIEGLQETRFSPLDGQQRLTTLFLLHWYLAWNDECWGIFQQLFREGTQSRFSYSVRQSSNEFFDELVAYQPASRPAEIRSLGAHITNQPWYFRNWRLDPTVQSTLQMLDALHRRFAGTTGLFNRLTDEKQPAITFQLLDLKNFGLSDDLYIKMNARGKPLTPFETFKARYEQELARQFVGQSRFIGEQKCFIADFVARRLDTAWSDLYWAYRNKATNLYDEIVMNLFRIVALVSRDPENDNFLRHVGLLRVSNEPPSYSTFHAEGWLDESFTQTLISLMESWVGADLFSKTLLPDARYFDEKGIFQRLIQDPKNLTNTEVTLFRGYALFVQKHEGSIDPTQFQEWMRIVSNLAVNSNIERPEELRTTARGLRDLLPQSTNILEYFSKLEPEVRVMGFSDQQVKEETLKAGLILNDVGWRPLLDEAEAHGYFAGQIEFLCEFSGAIHEWKTAGTFDWDKTTHSRLQARFKTYLSNAEAMFTAYGLANLGEFRWQRALLTQGDYLLASNSNSSLLVDAATDPMSWKRFLRGPNSYITEKRRLLKSLWDLLVSGSPLSEQLDEIIATATDLDPWIDAFVRTPQAFAFCEKRWIRMKSITEIYLLRKSQMNGTHAELYSYCFYHGELKTLEAEGALNPLKSNGYEPAIGTDIEPYIRFGFKYRGKSMWVRIRFRMARYRIAIMRSDLDEWPELLELLLTKGGFQEGDYWVFKPVALLDISKALVELARLLATVEELPVV